MQAHLRSRVLPLIMAFCVTLTGCANLTPYEPKQDLLGKTREDVISVMGPPAAVEQTDSAGTRMFYPRGPYGKHTYTITLDRNGRVSEWDQILNDENFNRILPGMTAAQVASIIGPSFLKTQLARQRGEFWAYRFHSPFCIWFEVEFDSDARVRSAGYGLPPECRSGRRGL